jgi:hypothetical protein
VQLKKKDQLYVCELKHASGNSKSKKKKIIWRSVQKEKGLSFFTSIRSPKFMLTRMPTRALTRLEFI